MNRLLVPIDGSDPADAAIKYAFDVFGDEAITLLYVIDPTEPIYGGMVSVSGYSEEWFEYAKHDEAAELFEAARTLVGEDDFETATVVGRPARAILDYAEEHDFDHIVIGSHGRSGVTRVLLGSVAELVVRRSPVPVTVVR